MRAFMIAVGAALAVRYIGYLRWSLQKEKKMAFVGNLLLLAVTAAAVGITAARL